MTVQSIYVYFVQEHLELSSEIKYVFYLNYFKDNYNFRFGQPRVDVCGQCEELGMKLKSKTLNDRAKQVAAAEHIVHKRRGKKLCNKMREITELCKESKDKAAIVFEYMQNIPLPKILVQEIFYYRNLCHYVFCVHDISQDESVFYTYHKGLAKKSPKRSMHFRESRDQRILYNQQCLEVKIAITLSSECFIRCLSVDVSKNLSIFLAERL